MEFRLSETQLMIRDTAREVANNTIAKRADEIEKEKKVPQEVFEALAVAGLMGIPFPEEYGGIDAGYVSFALACEEIARVSPSVCTSMVISVFFMEAIRHYGNEEQKNMYLIPGIEGKIRGSLAFTEPDTGSDPKQIQTAYRKAGDSYVLNGVKRFITNAFFEGPILVFAKCQETKVITAFVFDKFIEGYSLSTPWETVGLRGSSICDVFLDEVKVPASAIVGEIGQGFDILIGTVAHSKVAICAEFVGIMATAYDLAVKYAKEKTHRGQSIAKFQAIQLRIASVAALVESSRLMTYMLAEKSEDRSNMEHLNAWVGMVKAYVSDTAVECSTMAMNVLGAYGVTEEYRIERFVRRPFCA